MLILVEMDKILAELLTVTVFSKMADTAVFDTKARENFNCS